MCILLLLSHDILVIATSNGHHVVSSFLFSNFRRLRPIIIWYGYVLNLDVPIVPKVLVKHCSRPSCTTVLNCHLLVVYHFRLQTLIYHVSLILFLSKWLVRAHCHVLFLFACTRWLIVTTHWPASLSRDLLLLYALTKGSSNWPSISIVNHGLSMCLGGDAKLILVPAVSPVHVRVLDVLVLGNWAHEVVVLRDYPLVRRLSLLLRELRLALVTRVAVLGLHVFAYYLVLRQLLLGNLLMLVLVPVERAVVRI